MNFFLGMLLLGVAVHWKTINVGGSEYSVLIISSFVVFLRREIWNSTNLFVDSIFDGEEILRFVDSHFESEKISRFHNISETIDYDFFQVWITNLPVWIWNAVWEIFLFRESYLILALESREAMVVGCQFHFTVHNNSFWLGGALKKAFPFLNSFLISLLFIHLSIFLK